MIGSHTRTAAALALASAACGCARLPLAVPDAAKHRGVSWVGERRPVADEDFDPLVRAGVSWIAQNPFGWQRDARSTEVIQNSAGHAFWGETDAGIEATSRMARARGIRTLLKPHLWLMRPREGTWLEDVAMESDEDWRTWFDSYDKFILHYAALAERTGIEAMCVGAELSGTVVEREADWRRLIAAVREVYHGELTYAANWREFEAVPFWDALDYIGIQAYFPLTEREDPSVEELMRGFTPHVQAIERIQRRYGKPVLFTEIGYRTTPDAGVRPWEWGDERSAERAEEAGLRTQSRCYEAFFRSVWGRPWFAGVYFWKWFPSIERSTGPGFSPQGKPAGDVMAEWYRKSSG